MPSQYPQGGGTGLTYGNYFGFTSYGRVGFIFDDDIETGNAFNVVRNGQRWEEAPYQELGFYYRDVIEGLPIFSKTTLAFRQDLFHFNGDFDIDAALREPYIEVYPHPDVAIWVGERLYRGELGLMGLSGCRGGTYPFREAEQGVLDWTRETAS